MAESSPEQSTFIPKVSINVDEERKRPRLEAILFCEYASKSTTETPVFAGCFDRLYFSKEEAKVTSNFYLYVQTGETRRGDLQIAIFSPNDELHFAIAFDMGDEQEYLPKYPAQAKVLQRIRFPVPVEGNYWFDVSNNGKSLGGRALIIEFEKEEVEKDEHESGHTEEHS
jgi:hypothetical protein